MVENSIGIMEQKVKHKAPSPTYDNFHCQPPLTGKETVTPLESRTCLPLPSYRHLTCTQISSLVNCFIIFRFGEVLNRGQVYGASTFS